LIWCSRRVVSPVRALAESFVGAPHVPALTRTCLDAVSRCRVPRMLTPRASAAGGAFTIECPAIDVLCHRQGTVDETSGFRPRLARLGQSPALTDDCLPRACIDLAIRTALAPNGLRTALLTIQNAFRRIAELAEFYPVSRYRLPRLSTQGKTAPRTRSPDILHVFRAFSPRPLVKGRLGTCRVRPRFPACAFRRHAAVTKDTSDRRLQSHISKMSTRASRGYRPASRSFPRCLPMNEVVHAAPFASAQLLDHRTRHSCSRYDAWSAEPLTPPSPPRFHTA
jgi:hypothetical protein